MKVKFLLLLLLLLRLLLCHPLINSIQFNTHYESVRLEDSVGLEITRRGSKMSFPAIACIGVIGKHVSKKIASTTIQPPKVLPPAGLLVHVGEWKGEVNAHG